ncbi:putative D-serine dehydratase [Paratrimastix pyriformis]|uniref:D-serine dehydratase n=1 Tax=Paratrimastix pyriformis TaxID=342808 RepID=A0ABQ8UX33_9EUKA|nr:putative D-serine dehydratase [Paratrimastix pyriformis]
MRDMKCAEHDLTLLAPLIKRLFGEACPTGKIESDLLLAEGYRLSGMMRESPLLPATLRDAVAPNHFYVKCDHALPVSGSVKARGGIYEVLVHALRIAQREGLVSQSERDPCHVAAALTSERARTLFRRHTILVASTGNLGMAVGLAASALGFSFEVHMAADAKAWKKQRLVEAGARLVEYKADYSTAVRTARAIRAADATGLKHFVDDENSIDLMRGYGVGALRLQSQLEQARIRVDRHHPLFVYIPAGVGGAPAGILAGLANIYQRALYGIVLEPTTFPSCLLGVRSGCGASAAEPPGACPVGVEDHIARERCATIADGLACGHASVLGCRALRRAAAGFATVPDLVMTATVPTALHAQGKALKIEPSAGAALFGPQMLLGTSSGRAFLRAEGFLTRTWGGQWKPTARMRQATHVAWTTGGNMVPQDVYDEYLRGGAEGLKLFDRHLVPDV